MRNLLTPLRRGSEPDYVTHSPASLAQQYPDLQHEGAYLRKNANFKEKNDSVPPMLEAPHFATDMGHAPGRAAAPGAELPEGLEVKDMIVSAYDYKANMAIWKIVLAAAIGIGLGTLLTTFEVDGDAASWISFPGDLFIAALKCLIVPMVFCSVVTCIGELVEAGKAASIGTRTILYFAMSSVTSSTVGVLSGIVFSPLFKTQVKARTGTKTPTLALRCPGGGFLTADDSNVLSCMPAANATASTNTLFRVNDTTSFFSSSTSTYAKLSVSDQIFGIANDLVPDNIINAFASASTLSVIVFAICFGIALAKSVDRKREGDNYPLLLISHTNTVCRMLINQVVQVIPFAIVSMIAGSMAQYSSSVGVLESVGWLVLALAAGLITLTLGILGTIFSIITRRNVFSYLKNIVPAQIFIFGCSSSIATLPITMRCVDSTRQVSPVLSRFVLPLGATSNLNGTAVYMPLACIFMAHVGGLEEKLTTVSYVLLAFVGAIASFGVAPVPHSGLVMVITVWRTVFNQDVPQVFSLLVGTDWMLNRMRAIVNITNDTLVCRIIAEQCDETAFAQLQQHEGMDDHEEEAMTPDGRFL
ncbi:hypothetical protein ATCC90586_008825 [Pythium insidiosum]|nr:hypothetical protein ATCC90586_008825 [Pythium insidiosum]